MEEAARVGGARERRRRRQEKGESEVEGRAIALFLLD